MLSFLILGNWTATASNLAASNWNVSIFPVAVPLGLFLLLRALQTRNIQLTPPAALFLSPYASWVSWSIVPLSLIRHERLCLLASAATWIVLIALVMLHHNF